jgi:hypothetical protein
MIGGFLGGLVPLRPHHALQLSRTMELQARRKSQDKQARSLYNPSGQYTGTDSTCTTHPASKNLSTQVEACLPEGKGESHLPVSSFSRSLIRLGLCLCLGSERQQLLRPGKVVVDPVRGADSKKIRTRKKMDQSIASASMLCSSKKQGGAKKQQRSGGSSSSTAAMRKGPWTEEEDAQLVWFVRLFGERRWDFLAKVSGLRGGGCIPNPHACI